MNKNKKLKSKIKKLEKSLKSKPRQPKVVTQWNITEWSYREDQATK